VAVWLAAPEVVELPSRSVAEDGELLWVVRGPLVARAWAPLSGLLGRLEAQRAQEQAAVWNAQGGPVRTCSELKAVAPAVESPGHVAVVEPGHGVRRRAALDAAPDGSVQVSEGLEFVAQEV